MGKSKNAGLLLATVLLFVGLGSCLSTQATDGAAGDAAEGPFYHNPRNSLDWWGVYEGVIPSASGMGIEVRLTINRDYTFELRYEYIGRDYSAVASGTFRWDDAGRVITLDGQRGFPPFYQVGEGFLRQLDIAGNPIYGSWGFPSDEERYILRMVR